MKEYNEEIKNGIELIKNCYDDESHSNGFWDMAFCVAQDLVGQKFVDEAQEYLYLLFAEIANTALKEGQKMGKLDGTIALTHSEHRPCIVKGRKALFHRWEDKSEIHNATLRGTISGVIKGTLAIIEYEDGVVTECYPYEVKFCDNKFKEYAFTEVQQ